jgi:two-component system cell cycle response regulator
VTPPEELGSDRTVAAGGGQPATILIIEDDAVTRQQFSDVLRAQGHSVVLAGDCETGVQQLQILTVSAILLDLHLPGSDGLECLRRIRATPRYEHVPVVVITGDYFLDDSVSRHLSMLGARIYFKPVWADELAQLTRELLYLAANPGSPGAA